MKTLTKQEQLLKDEWDRIMHKHMSYVSYSGKYKLKAKKLPKLNTIVTPEVAVALPSRVTPGHSTALKPIKEYTGEKMIGIATMHKSNLIPIFSQEQAVETSQMRRN